MPGPADGGSHVRGDPRAGSAGAFAGANALYLEHIKNPLGRFSLDIDLQNQTEEIETIHRRLSVRRETRLKLVSRLSAEMYEYEARIGAGNVRIQIARPYLRHRRK